MSSSLPRDEALEKEDRIDEIKKKKNSPPVPYLLQAQQAPALPYAKVVERPGTGRYPAPSPNRTTHCCVWWSRGMGVACDRYMLIIEIKTKK